MPVDSPAAVAASDSVPLDSAPADPLPAELAHARPAVPDARSAVTSSNLRDSPAALCWSRRDPYPRLLLHRDAASVFARREVIPGMSRPSLCLHWRSFRDSRHAAAAAALVSRCSITK